MQIINFYPKNRRISKHALTIIILFLEKQTHKRDNGERNGSFNESTPTRSRNTLSK